MIVLTGPSASGKTEVAKLLFSQYGIKKVVTHTTRAKRITEVEDVDYHFVTKEEFLKLKAADEFVETTDYSNNFYGTSKSEIADDKAVIVDPNGVKAFMSLHDPRIIVFRLEASSTTRFNRMIMRGDELPTIQDRLTRDVLVFADSNFVNIKYTIDTENMTILDVAQLVYDTYMKELKAL